MLFIKMTLCKVCKNYSSRQPTSLWSKVKDMQMNCPAKILAQSLMDKYPLGPGSGELVSDAWHRRGYGKVATVKDGASVGGLRRSAL